MPRPFTDHFGKQSHIYSVYRPRYPDGLFAFLADLTPGHTLAWDCGTGNGQAALGLAKYFTEVIATDASPTQIANAFAHPQVEFRVAAAEDSGIPPGAVALIAIAQALHWFHLEGFYREVRRVAVTDAVIAAWSYGLTRITPAIDKVLDKFHWRTVNDYWPGQRHYVDNKYRDIPFPFSRITTPVFELHERWNADQLLGYLRTWSAVRYYLEDRGTDPVTGIEGEIRQLWGEPSARRSVRWPLNLCVGRVTPQ